MFRASLLLTLLLTPSGADLQLNDHGPARADAGLGIGSGIVPGVIRSAAPALPPNGWSPKPADT